MKMFDGECVFVRLGNIDNQTGEDFMKAKMVKILWRLNHFMKAEMMKLGVAQKKQ